MSDQMFDENSTSEYGMQKHSRNVTKSTLNCPNKSPTTTEIVDKSNSGDKLLNSSPISKSTWWSILVIVTIISFVTRFYNLDEPRHVCWDETHFGKMGSWYINRTFFFDVHPPLGKMLIGLAGYMTGYNGSFPFSKPGDQYGDTPYIGMRMFCASLGACLVPLCYCITWELSLSCGAALLASAIIILDTGVLSLSRYILLDPILMFFIMLSSYCLLRFQALHHRPFTFKWWFWLCSTGIFLACSIGVKFVGLFVILFAGYTVAWDLWTSLGDLQAPMKLFVQHFMARAACLILLPVAVYMMIFYVHFAVINKSGNGDGFFSSSFQSQLEGNALYNASMPQYAAYGSVVTMKNHRTVGAYLHSHWHLYPEGIGARQQQVTTYSHKDENNRWILKRFDRNPQEGDKVEMVKNGDLVRLEHCVTRRNLHSHREAAPITKQHYQVTGYGENGTGDSNDVFRISVAGVEEGQPISVVKSVFRLIHYSTGCALYSHNKQLPKWGWEQLEVTCNPKIRDKKTLWNLEEIVDDRLPNASFQVYSPSFLEKFLESHAVMTQSNKGLKPKEGEVTSRPWQWPINYKGQPFSGGDQRIYLLGNPVIWWGNLLVLLVFCLYAAATLVKFQRNCGDAGLPLSLRACSWLLLGGALHYLPFWTMTRVLYFHHYFPVFLYMSMLSAVFLDHTICCLSSLFNKDMSWVIYHSLYGLLLGILTFSFHQFSPLSYGMHGPSTREPNSEYSHLKWLNTWDF